MINTRGWITLLIWAAALLAFALSVHPIRAHDHKRPHLDGWYQGLRSPAGAPCCDGPHVDAMHLKDVDWTAQGKPGFQYRARIPKTGADMDKARRGERFESEWVDVPDSAVLDQPNLDGMTLVWPTYGYGGKTVRCFMPGPMT